VRDKRIAVVALVVLLLLASALGFYLLRPVANQLPTAAFSMTPAEGNAPLEVRLDGSASSDPDGNIAAYVWDFGDGAVGEGIAASHRFANAGEFTVKLTVTDDRGGSHSVSQTLTVRTRPVTGPPLYDIAPEDGVAVQGAEAWVRWRAPLPTKGRVLWRKVGDKDFLAVDAEQGDLLLARVGPLKVGHKYEYHVESTGDDYYQRSEPRTFTAEGGLTFTVASVEQTIRPDYDQTVKLTLKNDSSGKLKIAARALVQFADLPADIVGPGSVDEPVELAAGAELNLRLAVAAPDATRERYEIPVEAGGAYALAKLRVAKPDFKLAFRVVAEDVHTLAKTIEIRNEGESLTNLSIQVAPPFNSETRQEPAVNHAFLPGGAPLRVVVAPILYMEFQSLQAELVGAAHGQSARFSLEFKAPAGKRLLGIRTRRGRLPMGPSVIARARRRPARRGIALAMTLDREPAIRTPRSTARLTPQTRLRSPRCKRSIPFPSPRVTNTAGTSRNSATSTTGMCSAKGVPIARDSHAETGIILVSGIRMAVPTPVTTANPWAKASATIPAASATSTTEVGLTMNILERRAVRSSSAPFSRAERSEKMGADR